MAVDKKRNDSLCFFVCKKGEDSLCFFCVYICHKSSIGSFGITGDLVWYIQFPTITYRFPIFSCVTVSQSSLHIYSCSIYVFLSVYIDNIYTHQAESRNHYFGLVLALFYVAVYILNMKPCESFLLAKNGSWKLKQFALITFLLFNDKSSMIKTDDITVYNNLSAKINKNNNMQSLTITQENFTTTMVN